VRIDSLTECAWYSFIPIVESKEIMRHTISHNGFCVADNIVEAAMHLLYPLLQNAQVKDKYKETLYSYNNDDRYQEIVVDSIGADCANEIFKFVQIKDWTSIENNANMYRKALVRRLIYKLDFQRVKIFFNFVTSNLKRLFKKNGLFIAFIGPDGCGKTTTIRNIKLKMENVFLSNKMKLFYWRPFLLPRLSNLIVDKKKNVSEDNETYDFHGRRDISYKFKDKCIYLVKFFYYIFDYIIGIKKYISSWSRGGLVIFDRYYHDLIIYPERFGFYVPHKIVKWFNKIIIQPDVIFYLSADYQTLYDRKKEISVDEIIRQQNEYRKLSDMNKNIYCVDTGQSENETMYNIEKICLQYMAKRYQ